MTKLCPNKVEWSNRLRKKLRLITYLGLFTSIALIPLIECFPSYSKPAGFFGERRENTLNPAATDRDTLRARKLEAPNRAYGNLPLSFEANQGQTDSSVKFFTRGGGFGLFLTPTGATMTL